MFNSHAKTSANFSRVNGARKGKRVFHASKGKRVFHARKGKRVFLAGFDKAHFYRAQRQAQLVFVRDDKLIAIQE